MFYTVFTLTALYVHHIYIKKCSEFFSPRLEFVLKCLLLTLWRKKFFSWIYLTQVVASLVQNNSALVWYSPENHGKWFWRLCGLVDGSTEKCHFDVSRGTVSVDGFPNSDGGKVFTPWSFLGSSLSSSFSTLASL